MTEHILNKEEANREHIHRPPVKKEEERKKSQIVEVVLKEGHSVARSSLMF